MRTTERIERHATPDASPRNCCARTARSHCRLLLLLAAAVALAQAPAVATARPASKRRSIRSPPRRLRRQNSLRRQPRRQASRRRPTKAAPKKATIWPSLSNAGRLESARPLAQRRAVHDRRAVEHQHRRRRRAGHRQRRLQAGPASRNPRRDPALQRLQLPRRRQEPGGQLGRPIWARSIRSSSRPRSRSSTADIDEVVRRRASCSTRRKGQVRALKSAHSIVVLDFPDRVKMIREFVATLDNAGSGRFASAESRNGMPLEVGYFRTQHISAKTAEQALQAVLSKDGRVGVMEKEDRLLVTDYAENLAMVEKVLERIDHPRPQVRITALIYDISLQDIEQLGINWNHDRLQRSRSTPPATRRPCIGHRFGHASAVPSRRGRQHAHVHESEPALRHHGGRPRACKARTTPGCLPIRTSPCSKTKRRFSRSVRKFPISS